MQAGGVASVRKNGQDTELKLSFERQRAGLVPYLHGSGAT